MFPYARFLTTHMLLSSLVSGLVLGPPFSRQHVLSTDSVSADHTSAGSSPLGTKFIEITSDGISVRSSPTKGRRDQVFRVDALDEVWHGHEASPDALAAQGEAIAVAENSGVEGVGPRAKAVMADALSDRGEIRTESRREIFVRPCPPRPIG